MKEKESTTVATWIHRVNVIRCVLCSFLFSSHFIKSMLNFIIATLMRSFKLIWQNIFHRSTFFDPNTNCEETILFSRTISYTVIYALTLLTFEFSRYVEPIDFVDKYSRFVQLNKCFVTYTL